MKIDPADFARLQRAIAPLDTPERRGHYLRGEFPCADNVSDLNRRYRWDLLYASRIKPGDIAGITKNDKLYACLRDPHIDIALKSIVPPLR